MYEELFFYHTVFIWKASGKTRKKKKKSLTTVYWSGTQDSKLWKSVSFSNEKEILAKPF